MLELFSFLDPLREAEFPVEFVARVPGIAGGLDKEVSLAELERPHREVVAELGFGWEQLWRAEQVHGTGISRIEGDGEGAFVGGVDGLMTDRPDVLLGIYVADCGLIWLADTESGAVALLHSGRKGTEEGILPRAVQAMARDFGTVPGNLLAILGPCIRPPHYEVPFAEEIGRQARDAGVGRFVDCGICTGADVKRFYSYRLEKGATGRMLGLIAPRSQKRIAKSTGSDFSHL